MKAIKKIKYSVETNPEFIALSIIAILYGLKRTSINSKFKYSQKLTSLIYFINSEENRNLFKLKMDNNYRLKMIDYERLNNIHLKSKLIEPQVNRVLNALNTYGFINTDTENHELYIFLDKEKCKFIKQDMYKDLIENAKEIQQYYRYISSVQYQTYYAKLFEGIVNNE